MSLLTRDALRQLLQETKAPCVSLFMPTHRHAPEADQDPIRFKNLLRKARERVDVGPAAAARELLEPLEQLAGSSSFWRHQMDGLAVFRSPELLEHYLLPEPAPERLVVADSFHIKPLLKALQSNRRYHVLTLSRERVAVYEGTRTALHAVDLRRLPGSLREALGIEEEEPHLQYRTLRAGASAPIYHGHGLPDAARKDELRRFLLAVDKALAEERLADEGVPLLLAGVGYYFPIFREVSRYPQLAEEGVEGNFDTASPSELHARTWPVAHRIFERRVDEALAEHEEAQGRATATVDVAAIGRFMVEGRIRRLLTADGAEVRGRLDAETGAVERDEQAEGDDVLDDLAEGVLRHGGDVIVVPEERMPTRSPVAAILRW